MQIQKAGRTSEAEGCRHRPVSAGNGMQRWLQGRVCGDGTLPLEAVLGLGCMSEGLESWKDDRATYRAVQYGSHLSQAAV